MTKEPSPEREEDFREGLLGDKQAGKVLALVERQSPSLYSHHTHPPRRPGSLKKRQKASDSSP